MTTKEREIIENVVRRLKGEPKPNGFQSASPETLEALNNPALRRYLDTWVIGALECLGVEGHKRDLDLGVSLSR
jgi:hypothetical protein